MQNINLELIQEVERLNRIQTFQSCIIIVGCILFFLYAVNQFYINKNVIKIHSIIVDVLSEFLKIKSESNPNDN